MTGRALVKCDGTWDWWKTRGFMVPKFDQWFFFRGFGILDEHAYILLDLEEGTCVTRLFEIDTGLLFKPEFPGLLLPEPRGELSVQSERILASLLVSRVDPKDVRLDLTIGTEKWDVLPAYLGGWKSKPITECHNVYEWELEGFNEDETVVEGYRLLTQLENFLIP